jgi:hypothetical protein
MRSGLPLWSADQTNPTCNALGGERFCDDLTSVNLLMAMKSARFGRSGAIVLIESVG